MAAPHSDLGPQEAAVEEGGFKCGAPAESESLKVRRSFRHVNRLLVFEEPDQKAREEQERHVGPRASRDMWSPRKQPGRTTVLALQGYLQDVTLVQLTVEKGRLRSVYATRTCPSPLSVDFVYQLALAVWVSASLLAWALVALSLLFVVIYGTVSQFEPSDSSLTDVQRGMSQSRGVAVLLGLSPLLLYLLSLIAFHLWLLHDIFLDLTHTSESLEFATARGCGFRGSLCARSSVACSMKAYAWVLMLTLILLFFLPFAPLGPSFTSGAILANEVVFVMAVVAFLHAHTLLVTPCLRYCNFRHTPRDGRQERSVGKWASSCCLRCSSCSTELWLRGGLVCGNILTMAASCRCLCFEAEDDMERQAQHIEDDINTWEAFGADQARGPSTPLSESGWTMASPALPSSTAAPEAADARPSAPARSRTPSPQLSLSQQPSQARPGDGLALTREACCSWAKSTHTGVWLPAACGGPHEPSTMFCGCLSEPAGAAKLVNSLVWVASLWVFVGLAVHATFGILFLAGPVLAGVAASLSIIGMYACIMAYLWLATPQGDVLFRPGSSCGGSALLKSARAWSRRQHGISTKTAEQVWTVFLQYKVTLSSLLAGLLAFASARQGSTSGGLIAGILLLFIVPIGLCVFNAWQLGVRCSEPRHPGPRQGCTAAWCLVGTLGRVHHPRCHRCGDPTACCGNLAHRTCSSMWWWHALALAMTACVICLFTVIVYAPLPAMWLSIILATGIYSVILCHAIPTHGYDLATLAAFSDLPVDARAVAPHSQDELSSSTELPEVQAPGKALPSDEPPHEQEVVTAPPDLPPSRPPALTLPATLKSANLRAPSVQQPFVTQQVALPVQAGERAHLQHHKVEGVLCEDVDAFAAACTERERVAYNKAHGGNRSFRDPVQSALFIERHLRWKLVAPLFVALFVVALLLIALVDRGLDREGGALVGWVDVSKPVLAQQGKAKPRLPFCDMRVAGLGILDYGVLAKAAYLGTNHTAYVNVLQTLIPGSNVSLNLLVEERLHQPLYGVATIRRPAALSHEDVLTQARAGRQDATRLDQAMEAFLVSNSTSGLAADALKALVRRDTAVPAINTTVLSIRGSLQGFDWAQDFFIWGGPGLVQALQFVFPLLRPLGWTGADEYLISAVGDVERGAFSEYEATPRAFFVPVARQLSVLKHVLFEGQGMQVAQEEFRDSPTEKYRDASTWGDELVVTGHSLGGGVAMIAGAATSVAAVAYSGPGPVLGRRKYAKAIQVGCPECPVDTRPEATDAHAFNVVPLGDVVPWLGGQPSKAVDIPCDSGAAACHSVIRSMCTIMQSCGDPWGRSLFQFKESFGAGSLDTLSDCCVHGQYGRGHAACKRLLCGEIKVRPAQAIPSALRRLC